MAATVLCVKTTHEHENDLELQLTVIYQLYIRFQKASLYKVRPTHELSPTFALEVYLAIF